MRLSRSSTRNVLSLAHPWCTWPPRGRACRVECACVSVGLVETCTYIGSSGTLFFKGRRMAREQETNDSAIAAVQVGA